MIAFYQSKHLTWIEGIFRPASMPRIQGSKEIDISAEKLLEMNQFKIFLVHMVLFPK